MGKREKQIEEMARVVCWGNNGGTCEDCMANQIIHFNECEWKTKIATVLYDAGYRKQVQGVWKTESNGVVVCSNCGEEHEWDDYRPSYCEDCGARMKDDREE